MRKLIPLIIALGFMVLSFPTYAQNACSNVSCDCSSLPIDSWKSICKEKEKQLTKTCDSRNNFTPQGFCSIHGPAANRIPLSINLDNSVIVAEEDIVRLNYKIAILYWSLHKDLDILQDKVNQDSWQNALHYVKLIDMNTDHLFNIQKQVVNSYLALADEAEAQKSWRDYSVDTLKVGNMLYDYGKAMLNAADAQSDVPKQVDTHKLAFELLKISGRLHEQAGYAYAGGVRHALASKTWKQAADISETLSNAEVNRANIDMYRQQTAMRLNKASYYWVVGQVESDTSVSDAEKMQQNGAQLSKAIEL